MQKEEETNKNNTNETNMYAFIKSNAPSIHNIDLKSCIFVWHFVSKLRFGHTSQYQWYQNLPMCFICIYKWIQMYDAQFVVVMICLGKGE